MVQIVPERSALRLAAYREAGHAASALDQGQWFRGVSVLRPSNTLGGMYVQNLAHLDLSPPISLAAKDLLERRICIVLAGLAAEDWFRGVPVHELRDFDRQLTGVVTRLYRNDAVARAYLDYLRAQVSAWLAQAAVQRTINMIATALVARRTLTRGEARGIWQQTRMLADCRNPEPIPFPA